MKRKGQFFIISAVVVVILLMSITKMLSNNDNQEPAIHLRDINDALRVLENNNYELSELMSILSDDAIYAVLDAYLMKKKALLSNRGYLMNYDINESENTIKITYDIESIHMEQTIPILKYSRISAWDFNEGVGVVAKDKTSTNDGELINFSWDVNSGWTDSCISGNCLVFDGVDDYVEVINVAKLPTGNTIHSISAWIRVNSLPVTRAWILLLGDAGIGSHHWLINSAGATQFGVWNGGQVQPVLPIGVWTHVVITHNGTFVSGYVNGAHIDDDSATFNLQGIPLTISKKYVSEDFFNGTIDNVRIYNQSLTAEQVQYLYSNGRN